MGHMWLVYHQDPLASAYIIPGMRDIPYLISPTLIPRISSSSVWKMANSVGPKIKTAGHTLARTWMGPAEMQFRCRRTQVTMPMIQGGKWGLR